VILDDACVWQIIFISLIFNKHKISNHGYKCLW